MSKKKKIKSPSVEVAVEPIEVMAKAQPSVAVPRQAVAAYSSAQDNQIASARGSYLMQPRYDNRRQESEVYWEAYLSAPWIRPCVDLISRSGAKDWRLVPVDTTKDIVDVNEVAPILRFLNSPNEIDTWSSLSAKVLREMIIQGSCVMYLGRSSADNQAIRDVVAKAFQPFSAGIANIQQEIEEVVGEIAIDGVPVYCRVLPLNEIEIQVDKNGHITGYVQWTIEGRQIQFKPEEILHIYHPLSSSLYGDSLLAPIITVATCQLLIDRRQKKVLSSDIVFDALFTVPDTTNEEDTKRVYEQLNTTYRKDGNSATFFLSNADLKYANVAKARDADFMQATLNNRNTICLSLGIPLSVLGDSSSTSSTYSSGADTALRSFLENVVRPLTNHLEYHVNRAIMSSFGALGLSYVLEYVLEDADDWSAIEQMYNIAINNGTMTRNEKRKKMGLDPMPGGDVLTITAGATVASLDTILNPPKPEPPPAPIIHQVAPDGSPIPHPSSNGKSSNGKMEKAHSYDTTEAHRDDHASYHEDGEGKYPVWDLESAKSAAHLIGKCPPEHRDAVVAKICHYYPDSSLCKVEKADPLIEKAILVEDCRAALSALRKVM